MKDPYKDVYIMDNPLETYYDYYELKKDNCPLGIVVV